jgi:hypothetical protein
VFAGTSAADSHQLIAADVRSLRAKRKQMRLIDAAVSRDDGRAAGSIDVFVREPSKRSARLICRA